MKKVLFEIDQNILLTDTIWVKYENNIWYATYSWDENEKRDFAYGVGGFGFGVYGSSATQKQLPTPTQERAFKVSSVLGSGSQLLEVSNLTELRENENSFLWDGVNQVLYIHAEEGVSPEYAYSSVEVGATKGFSNKATFYNSLYYDPRVTSIPNITNTIDSQFHSKISFDPASIQLNNKDSYFDDFGNENYYGSEVRIYYGDDGDFDLLYTGYVESYAFSGSSSSHKKIAGDTITISANDNRKLLTNSIPDRLLTIEDYPFLSESEIGGVIPLGYGYAKKGKTICLNEEETTSTFVFIFVDTQLHSINSVNKVYVNNKEVPFFNESLTLGTFELSHSEYEKGDLVTVDFDGYEDENGLILNPLDIISDLLSYYTTIKYTNLYYDIVSWELIRDSLTQTTSLYISKRKKILEIVNDLTISVFGLFTINSYGKIVFKIRDINKTATKTIKISELIKETTESLPSTEYLNSVLVKYNNSEENEKSSVYINTDKQEELFLKHKSNIEKEYNSLLNTKQESIDLSNTILSFFGGIFQRYLVETKMQYIDLEITDCVNLQINTLNKTPFYIKCEVLGTNINLNDNTFLLELRFIEDIGLDLKHYLLYDVNTLYLQGDVVMNNGILLRANTKNKGETPFICV